jgi:hypothetical protein
MADYYYARVRVFKSTSSEALTDSNLENNRVKTNLVTIADKSSDDKIKKQYAWYVVDVHKSTVPNFQTWSALSYAAKGPILAGDKKKVTFNWPTSDTMYTGSDITYYTVLGSILYRDGHVEFTLSNNLGKPRTIIPTLTISQNDATGSDVNVSQILWENDSKLPFAIKFTGAAGAPSYPTDSVAKWLKTGYYHDKYGDAYVKKNITISSTKWSACNKRWGYIVIDNKDATGTFWHSNEAGTEWVMPKSPKPDLSKDAPKRAAWTKVNGDLFAKYIDDAACKDPTKVPPTTGADFNVEVSPPTDQLRWNPPPHTESRSVPYSARKNFYSTASLNPEFSTFDDIQAAASFYSATDERVYSNNVYSYLERGRIFQDAESAAVLNSTNTTGKGTASGKAKQWGFRFMYNPTSFSYGTQANNSIDWTLGSKDTAALLAGNQTVSFQLLINRVVDLSYLNALYGITSDKVKERQMSMEQAYGRMLEDVEIEGIRNRGTEYDLEFLYRCLTGDPMTNNPLLNETLRKTGSADLGYITGIPLWLYLNDNLRYFGSVTGFDVNHLIFNTEMVPTLTYVTVSFSRYPAQFANDAKSLKSVHDSFFPPAST